jgi:predicted nucleic acid-binding protein
MIRKQMSASSTLPKTRTEPSSKHSAGNWTCEPLRRQLSRRARQPNAGIVKPGDRHLEILGRLLRDSQSTGSLVMDAALAAVAIEHGATLCSTDCDFARFDGAWYNPIA